MATTDGATDASDGAGADLAQHCGACPHAWHVVATEHQAERLAHQSVVELGFLACLPLIRRRLPGTAARAPRSITLPVFPGYIFAAWPPGAEWPRVRRARGVSGVLTGVGTDLPARVPDAFMAALSARMDEMAVIQDLSVPDLLPALEARTWVRITRGPMAGRLALVEWSTEERVGLLLEVLGGDRHARLRRDYVEPTTPIR